MTYGNAQFTPIGHGAYLVAVRDALGGGYPQFAKVYGKLPDVLRIGHEINALSPLCWLWALAGISRCNMSQASTSPTEPKNSAMLMAMRHVRRQMNTLSNKSNIDLSIVALNTIFHNLVKI